MEFEHTVEVADFEDPPNPSLWHDDSQVSVQEAHSLQSADNDPETERVDEVDAGEVKHQKVTAFSHLSHDSLTKVGTTHDIKLARDRQNGPRPFPMRVRHDLHTLTLIRQWTATEPPQTSTM